MSELPSVVWDRDPSQAHETMARLQTESPDAIRTQLDGLSFTVWRNSAIPPSLETYTHSRTVGALLGRLATSSEVTPIRVADIGTGSGIFAITLRHMLDQLGVEELAVPITATDISFPALHAARENITSNNVSGISLDQADCLDGMPPGSIDIMFANPPFLPQSMQEEGFWSPTQATFYPPESLIGGQSGLEIYAKIFQQLPSALSKRGLAVVQCQDTHRTALETYARTYLGPYVATGNLAGYERTALLVGNHMWMEQLMQIRGDM